MHSVAAALRHGTRDDVLGDGYETANRFPFEFVHRSVSGSAGRVRNVCGVQVAARDVVGKIAHGHTCVPDTGEK